MSEEFTWRPDASSRRIWSLRGAIVLVCAGLGIVVGIFYPLRMVMTPAERTSLPRISDANSASSEPSPNVDTEFLLPLSGVVPTVHPGDSPETAARVTLLNPGTADPKAGEEVLRPEAISGAASHPKLRGHSPAARRNRNVLVVVRRRGPPYDTKVLHGHIRDGRLFVDARGIILR